eukprot:203278-Chlamydomonas_euryale.AAC.1
MSSANSLCTYTTFRTSSVQWGPPLAALGLVLTLRTLPAISLLFPQPWPTPLRTARAATVGTQCRGRLSPLALVSNPSLHCAAQQTSFKTPLENLFQNSLENPFQNPFIKALSGSLWKTSFRTPLENLFQNPFGKSLSEPL